MLPLLLGVGIFYLVWQAIGGQEIFDSFKAFSGVNLALWLIVSVCIMCFNTLRWQMILKTQKANIPFIRLLSYKLSGFAISFATPSAQVGGEPVRAFLLKKKEKVSYAKSISTIIMDKVFELTVNALFAFAGFIILITTFSLPREFELMLMLGFFIALSLIVMFYHQTMTGKSTIRNIFKITRLDRIKKLKKYEKHIIEMEERMASFFSHHPDTFRNVFLVSLLLWALMFLEYKFLLQLFGVKATFDIVFLTFSVVGLSYIVPIPGAVGILEMTQASLFELLSLSPGTGIALALTIRARDTIWMILGFSFISHYGVNHILGYILEPKKKVK